MTTLTITRDDTLFNVDCDGRVCDKLSWDEMLGTVAALTINPQKVGKFLYMNTPEKTPPQPICIQTGKLYQSRNGRKKVCLWTCRPKSSSDVVVMDLDDGEIYTVYPSGLYYATGESIKDLIAPWTDKPEVDWSKMPAWCNYAAMDKDTRWFCFPLKPKAEMERWYEGMVCEIPPEHHPNWTGDWRESLVVRQEVGK